MSHDPTDPQALNRTLEALYGDSGISDEQLEASLNRSLDPRGPDLLFETIGALGLGPQHMLLDIGCRDARHTCELVKRFGCRALGIDPVAYNIVKAQALIARYGLAERVSAIDGRIEALPAGNREVDYIWCRDVLTHVPDLRAGLAECVRVLQPAGAMLVYMTVATELLEPREAEWLYPPLGVVPANMDSANVEAAFGDVGLQIVRRDAIGSEWREHWEEDGTRTTSKQLLQIARMRRDRERLLAEIGAANYDSELANCHWGVYQMLGKLRPMLYVLEPRH